MSAPAVWRVPSNSHPGAEHLVMRLPDGSLSCDCESFHYRQMCRHVLAILTTEGDTMSTAVTTPFGALETVLATGDLSKLTTEDRTRYLLKICDSLGLNPLTRPFQYITLSGRLTLYATRDATDQLRKINSVSIRIVSRERTDDLYIVQAEATDRTGRTDTSLGVVSIKGLAGEALANALMKTETKSKRRVTLSICGLGMLDETEVGTVPGAVVVDQPPLAITEPPRDEPAVPAPAIDLALEQARTELADAMKAHGWTTLRLVDSAMQVWPDIHTRADLGRLTAAEVRRLTELVTGESIMGLDERGTPRIMPAAVAIGVA